MIHLFIKKISVKVPVAVRVLSLALLASIPALAHVNSPDVYFDGWAGPYHVLVTVRPPPVIPGIAEVQIRSDSSELHELRLVPMRITGPGAELSPIPDLAVHSQHDPQMFTGQLWIMERGSWKIRLLAEGAKGRGELGVPVPAVSRMSLPMARALSALLIAMGLLLAAGLVNIVGAAACEARTEPGQAPLPALKRRARLLMAVCGTLLLAAFYFGGQWWDAKAADVRHSNYALPRVTASLVSGHRMMLQLSNPNAEWHESVRLDDLIADHGHLMHLFLLRAPALDRFWHLHPVEMKPGEFSVELPGMAAGHYQIFADIVHRTGFPETQVGDITLPEITGPAMAGDDSAGEAPTISTVMVGTPAEGKDTSSGALLSDGARMIWERPAGALKLREPIWFRFRVEDAVGKPVTNLEPYMGMSGHAFFVRDDLSVFAHVHPAGSVSMAALDLAQQVASPGGAMRMVMPDDKIFSEVSFPYGFPEAGVYRIFVQVKRAGRIETGVFDARVEK